MANASESDEKILLSQNILALLNALDATPKKITLNEGDAYEVSQTVTFLGVLYEKLRNAVEFNEEHLIRRMAISRILRRRLAINLQGKGEGENLIRELLWANYLPKRSVGISQVSECQKIIDDYIYLFQEIQQSHTIKNKQQLFEIIVELVSCELEEKLSYRETYRTSSYLYFFYQVLKDKVRIHEISDDDKNTFFYTAAESALLKNDPVFIRYHLFTINFGPLSQQSNEVIKKIAKNFHLFYKESERILNNPYNDKLVKFARKQTAPFRVLYHILDNEELQKKDIFSHKSKLHNEVATICARKYKEIGDKLSSLAFRSIVYIFLTKMVLVLLVEVPLSKVFFGELSLMPLAINTLFPPVFMGVIVSFINPPSSDNTTRIFNRIVEVVNEDPSFETTKVEFNATDRIKRPSLFIAFSVLYLFLFTIIFGGIYSFLNMMGFNILSKTIFIFFVSVVAFFGYRIRQTPKEYILESKNSLIISFFTFLFMPIIYVGKILSSQIAKINLFMVVFDTLIETPFKIFIDIFEEWSLFVKAKKDELI